MLLKYTKIAKVVVPRKRRKQAELLPLLLQRLVGLLSVGRRFADLREVDEFPQREVQGCDYDDRDGHLKMVILCCNHVIRPRLSRIHTEGLMWRNTR